MHACVAGAPAPRRCCALPPLTPLLPPSLPLSNATSVQVCEQRGLVREMVYVLGRMGSAEKALRLIVEGLRDVAQASAASPLLLALEPYSRHARRPCSLRPGLLPAACSRAWSFTGAHARRLPRPPRPLTPSKCVQAVEFVQMQRDDELWEQLIALTLGDAQLTGETPSSETNLLRPSALAEPGSAWTVPPALPAARVPGRPTLRRPPLPAVWPGPQARCWTMRAGTSTRCALCRRYRHTCRRAGRRGD